jgi:hypothetical protein
LTFWHYAYAVAGVLLTLYIFFVEDDQITVNAILVALLFGWAIGVPVFVILLVFFGSWPVIVRDLWALLCWPVRSYRRRKTGGEQCES